MDRLTRHELKQDEFRETLDQLEQYVKTHLREILTVTILIVAVVGLAGGLKYFYSQQETNANLELAAALKTFEAYVGPATPETASAETFATAREKYQKAREQFNTIVLKYQMFPRPKAVSIARYHVGICESLLGDSAAAINTLQEVSRDRDREIASLAQFALAGEFLRAGKEQEAVKIYRNLADHPSLDVPRSTALLALAEVLQGSQPARARQVYEQVQREYGQDPIVGQALRQQMAELPPGSGGQPEESRQ
jgi:tetratricopeptide (TPR) repeat protein